MNPITPVKRLGNRGARQTRLDLEINTRMNKSIMAVAPNVCINK